MEYIKIVLLAIAAAISYGILHDQITVRVCIEYFTIGHPPVFSTTSPTWLAVGWGIIATWWVGLLLGVPLSICAQRGTRPKVSAVELIRPLSKILCVMGIVALLSGLAGFVAASNGWVWLLEPLRSLVPAEKHTLFLADLWSHVASYAAGFAGGIGLCWMTWKRRKAELK